MTPFDLHLHTRVVFGAGVFARLGDRSREVGITNALVVSDAGIVALGLVDRAVGLLRDAGIRVARFHEFGANPDTRMVEAGRVVASQAGVNGVVALGGGSSLDCAKGINFVLTNGGSMRDYRGFGKASQPMLPSIGIPTSAGTGSEAQAYALISDAETHVKMACGDPKAAFRVAILDPELTVSQPPSLTAVVGLDAISHAVESWVTTRRTEASDLFGRDAWRRLRLAFPRVLLQPTDLDARGDMLFGAHLGGLAVEHSMLGAAHACANPLTARYGTTHGVAVALMLPHVVRWNREVVAPRYRELADVASLSGGADTPDGGLADDLAALARLGGLPASLSAVGVTDADLPALADAAAEQWTGAFNPRPFDRAAALALYRAALSTP